MGGRQPGCEAELLFQEPRESISPSFLGSLGKGREGRCYIGSTRAPPLLNSCARVAALGSGGRERPAGFRAMPWALEEY